MFYGTLPHRLIEQIFYAVDLGRWSAAYVCCSGTFKIERAIRKHWPNLPIVSNDVSVFSVPIGQYLAGNPIRFEFTGKLAWLEVALAGKSHEHRLAALMVAAAYTRYATGGDHPYKKHHRTHYETAAESFIDRSLERIKGVLESKLDGFFAGDWRAHVETAISEGAGIAAFPPFFMGDYEKMFQFIAENIAWDAPAYDLYNPSMLHSIVDRIDASGVPYFVLSDQEWEDRAPVLKYVEGMKVPHFGYGSADQATYRNLRPVTSTAKGFSFDKVDPARITRDSKITCVQVGNAEVNYLRDVCLQAGLQHSNGILSYLIYIDGALLGALVFRKPLRSVIGFDRWRAATHLTELLSDPVVVNDCKLAKLVAMIALSKKIIWPMDRGMVRRTTHVCTTARTNHPVSMKYRGPYKLFSRAENPEGEGTRQKWRLSYVGETNDMSAQEIFEEWYDKHGRKEIDAYRLRHRA